MNKYSLLPYLHGWYHMKKEFRLQIFSSLFLLLVFADKPRCEIERREIDDQDTLICTAYGNPEEVRALLITTTTSTTSHYYYRKTHRILTHINN